MIEAALFGLVHAIKVPFDRTWGSAKHDLLDEHGEVCHVPLTQVAVAACTQAVSPSLQGSFS